MIVYVRGASICRSCAEKAGCTQNDRDVTNWWGICHYCKKHVEVCSTDDSDWPLSAMMTPDTGGTMSKLADYILAVLAHHDAEKDRQRAHADWMAADEREVKAHQKLIEARNALDAEIVEERGGI